MTERKPPGVDFESWVDKQIREAGERGAFDDLAGKGKPLPDLDKPYDELWWVRKKMHQEGVAMALPPALALRKDVEDVHLTAAKARSEREVRRIVAELNERIAEARRRPPAGPPLTVSPLDADEVVERWRKDRSG